jgi:hypothetical protein
MKIEGTRISRPDSVERILRGVFLAIVTGAVCIGGIITALSMISVWRGCVG